MYGTYLGRGRVLISTTWGAKLLASADDLSLTPDLVAYGTYDVPLTNFILTELRPGDVAVDVGANIGLFTLLMAQQVGSAGRVYAYEAEPRNVGFLRDNVALNYANDWVTIIPRAAASSAGTVPFFRTERFRGNASLVEHDAGYFDYFGVDSNERIDIEAETLDSRLMGAGDIALVKIDVEGAEMQVLHGMRSLLESGAARRVCMEVIRRRMPDWDAFAEAIRGWTDAGWQLFTLDAEGSRQPLSLGTLLEVGRFSQVLMEAPAIPSAGS